MLPPAELLQDCAGPDVTAVSTNADLLLYSQGLKHSLRVCNADKQALRHWASTIENNHGL